MFHEVPKNHNHSSLKFPESKPCFAFLIFSQFCDIENLVNFSQTLANLLKFTVKEQNFPNLFLSCCLSDDHSRNYLAKFGDIEKSESRKS